MKIIYNPERDELRVLFLDAPIERSTILDPDLIIDFDIAGSVVGLEIAQASKRMHDPYLIEYAEAPPPSEPSE
jgi:uncharacterized protein YuzE